VPAASDWEAMLAGRTARARQMLIRRRWAGRYRQVRCAWCYRRLWPWQATVTGANYFPHPYMTCHRADFSERFLRDNLDSAA
jgi:hypothetical protein